MQSFSSIIVLTIAASTWSQLINSFVNDVVSGSDGFGVLSSVVSTSSSTIVDRSACLKVKVKSYELIFSV